MNVYYEDGPLENPPKECYWIDAVKGYRDCDIILSGCYKLASNRKRFSNVYTNFPLVLSRKYLAKFPRIKVHIRSKDSWVVFEPEKELYDCENPIHQAYKVLN